MAIIQEFSPINEKTEFIIMCCYCKKKKVDNHWEEDHNHYDLEFGRNISHGICPHCQKLYYSDIFS